MAQHLTQRQNGYGTAVRIATQTSATKFQSQYRVVKNARRTGQIEPGGSDRKIRQEVME